MTLQLQTKPGRVLLTRLRKRVRDYETRYEMSSELMEQAVRCRGQKETADISKWMHAYSTLQDLEKTRTIGTP